MKLNIGPGPSCVYFKKFSDWEMMDAEPSRASTGLKIDFNVFEKIDRPNDYYTRVYASHVLEHVHPSHTIRFLKEINRTMKNGAIFRIIVPDARKSIEKYLNGEKFKLFEERKVNHGKNLNPPMSDFEAMKMCFVSATRQPVLTKNKNYIPFAHQNAWDFESIVNDLMRSGFKKEKIFRTQYGASKALDFDFETKLPTEARRFDRSMYVEVIK
jgi:predicted SAM-dependent methyltransferase